VDELSSEGRAAIDAMLNIDVVGVDTPLELLGDGDLIEVARVAGVAAGVDAASGDVPAGGGSDHLNFAEAGIPVVMFTRDDDLIHTEQDVIERILAEKLEDTARIALATLEALSTS
jgi:hypothetical protein